MRAIYGINPVREALTATRGTAPQKLLVKKSRGDRVIDEILKEAMSRNLFIERTSVAKLTEAAGSSRHQGVVLLYASDEYEYSDIEDIIADWKLSPSGDRALILIVDSVEDPGNLGAMIRSALGAGAAGVIIPKDRAAGVTATVVKASAGATEHIQIAKVTNIARAIERLKKENIWVVGLSGGSANSIFTTDLDTNVAIVIGNEASGLRRLVEKSCDLTVSIPISGKLESLNAAQAATIALFEVKRQRG
ncbi:MAG: 23S rRNA (guanosine(2251)-2'-O)-methyltransferase RlmB [Thermodesulfobacteriota bacterium]